MQTLLDVHRRPVVMFDASNAKHRQYMAAFLKNGTWGKSPVTFYAPDNVSVRSYALESMLEFYMRKEFAIVDRINTARAKLIAK